MNMILIGLVVGLVIGFVVGNIYTKRKFFNELIEIAATNYKKVVYSNDEYKVRFTVESVEKL